MVNFTSEIIFDAQSLAAGTRLARRGGVRQGGGGGAPPVLRASLPEFKIKQNLYHIFLVGGTFLNDFLTKMLREDQEPSFLRKLPEF